MSFPTSLAALVKRPLRDLWHRRILSQGLDVTAGTAEKSALVVAPHPDDETIGCGATIARKRASGTSVHVLVVFDGGSSHPLSQVITRDELVEIRSSELREACRLLGVPEESVSSLALADGSADGGLSGVVDHLAALLAELRPDEIYLPSALDWHRDHVVVNAAGHVALNQVRNRPTVLEYPIWYWAEGPWRWTPATGWLGKTSNLFMEPFTATCPDRPHLVATEGFVETKKEALRAYRSQTENLTGESTWATLPTEWFAPFLGRWELALLAEPAGPRG